MAKSDSTTKTAKEWPTTKEIDEVIGTLRAIRAAGDLLCMAADTYREGRAEFQQETLAETGVHLGDLATEALVILKWEGPETRDGEAPAPQDQKQWEWLGSLMDRAFWPLDGILETLKDDERYSDLLAALVPLVDGAKVNLEIIEKVLGQSFGGPIKIETNDSLRIHGQYQPEDFDKAFVGGREEA